MSAASGVTSGVKGLFGWNKQHLGDEAGAGEALNHERSTGLGAVFNGPLFLLFQPRERENLPPYAGE